MIANVRRVDHDNHFLNVSSCKLATRASVFKMISCSSLSFTASMTCFLPRDGCKKVFAKPASLGHFQMSACQSSTCILTKLKQSMNKDRQLQP